MARNFPCADAGLLSGTRGGRKREIRYIFFSKGPAALCPQDVWRRRIRAYLSYHRQQRYTAKYPAMETFRVITITETRWSRERNCRRDLHELLPTAKSRRAYVFVASRTSRLRLLPRPIGLDSL